MRAYIHCPPLLATVHRERASRVRGRVWAAVLHFYNNSTQTHTHTKSHTRMIEGQEPTRRLRERERGREHTCEIHEKGRRENERGRERGGSELPHDRVKKSHEIVLVLYASVVLVLVVLIVVVFVLRVCHGIFKGRFGSRLGCGWEWRHHNSGVAWRDALAALARGFWVHTDAVPLNRQRE